MLLLMKMTLCLNSLWTSHYKVVLRRNDDIVVYGRKCVDYMTCNCHDSYSLIIVVFLILIDDRTNLRKAFQCAL